MPTKNGGAAAVGSQESAYTGFLLMSRTSFQHQVSGWYQLGVQQFNSDTNNPKLMLIPYVKGSVHKTVPTLDASCK